MKNLIIMVSLALFFSMAFIPSFQQDKNKPWKVPATAEKMENPIEGSKENINMGKMIYSKHCKSCHGKKGEGDGNKAAELETFPGDFTLEETQKQTDGTLFYKTAEGRDDMPSFKKKLTEEDIWVVVHYVRTLK